MIRFRFEVRSNKLTKSWDSTEEFCIDHDQFIPHQYQKVILEIASQYGVYRKLSLLDDKKGMLLEASLPSYEFFSEWLSKRIDYFHKVNDSETFEDRKDLPSFPNSFQKSCWTLSNFKPLVPLDKFWLAVLNAFELANNKCLVNLQTFDNEARRVYFEVTN